MNAYDDNFESQFNIPLSVYKPRPWGEGQIIGTPGRTVPDPSSKTNLPKRRVFAKTTTRPMARPLTSIHDFAHSHYNKA